MLKCIIPLNPKFLVTIILLIQWYLETSEDLEPQDFNLLVVYINVKQFVFVH